MPEDKAAALARVCTTHLYNNDQASVGLGIEIIEAGPGYVAARMTVRDDMLNGHGSCHGGFIFALADSAFAFACCTRNTVAVAAGASIEFLSPARPGDCLLARARVREQAGRTGICDVEISNQDGCQIALFRGRSYSRGEPLLPDAGHGA